jgi:hypothetical protein
MANLLEETDYRSTSSVESLSPVLDPAIYGPDVEAIPTVCSLRYGPSKYKYLKNTGKSGKENWHSVFLRSTLISHLCTYNLFLHNSPRIKTASSAL